MQNNFKGKRVAFFGTPDFCIEFLELFMSIGLDISLVVTGEDKPYGRGMRLKSPAPKTWAEQNDVKYFQPKKLDEKAIEDIGVDWDLFIVIAYGKIIPEKLINIPKFGTINLHYSLLPKYRGASPVESAILNEEAETGITIQQMVYKLDAGDVLLTERVSIFPDDTTKILRDKLNRKAKEVFPNFLNDLFDMKLFPIPQDEKEATSCKKFKKEDMDVSKDIETKNLKCLYTKWRAFDGRIFFNHKNGDKTTRLKISEMSRDKILKVLPESKKEITADEYENAYGSIFG